MGYSSPDDSINYTLKRPVSRYGHRHNDSYENSISTLAMPCQGSDSDEEDLVSGLVLDQHGERSAASSTVSMEIHDRLDALTRANEELIRKKIEADQTLQNKLAEHDLELEENQQRLEELRSELNASNREEKELRAKDVSVFRLPWIHMGSLLFLFILFFPVQKYGTGRCAGSRDGESAKTARLCEGHI
jgi:hypothetical protein